jgi:cold shock CspA family protein
MVEEKDKFSPDYAANVEVFEIAGSIKWFDVSKGYGFIVPDNGLADVLLHVTCLRAGGYQTAYEGARVHCQVLKRPRGLQAFRVLWRKDCICMAAGRGWVNGTTATSLLPFPIRMIAGLTGGGAIGCHCIGSSSTGCTNCRSAKDGG